MCINNQLMYIFMKKLLFTAVAIVAFSGVSIANTIADEDVVKENKEAKVV